jgi:hypothetical protein
MSKYSQFEEEEILLKLIGELKPKSKTFVEFGCLPENRFSNTHLLKEQGWKGHYFDSGKQKGVIQEWITAENINDVFKKHKVPKTLTLLSIDVDGNDYHLFKALTTLPKILVIEYNYRKERGIQEYDPAYVWDGRSQQFGSSEKDMLELAESKGYTLYGKTIANLILCRNK